MGCSLEATGKMSNIRTKHESNSMKQRPIIHVKGDVSVM